MPIVPDKTYYVDYEVQDSNNPITLSWKVYNKVGSVIEMYVEHILIFPKSEEEKPLATSSEGAVKPGTCTSLQDKILDCYFEYHNLYNEPRIVTDFSIDGGVTAYINSTEEWHQFDNPGELKRFRVRITFYKPSNLTI